MAPLSRHRAAAQEKADEIGEGLALEADVLDEEALRGARDELLDHWRAADILVNAVAPGFFLAKQNRSALLNPDGSYTGRARRIIEHTFRGDYLS